MIIYMNNFKSFDSINVLETYIQSGQPLDIIDKTTDYTLFMFVCDKILNAQPNEYKFWINTAMKMLDFNPEQLKLNYANRDGITALILVCGVDVDISNKILSFGAKAVNLNSVEKDNKMNALMYACTEETEEVALEMLDLKPEVEDSLKNINKNGYTPLMIACEEGLEEIVLKMLEGFEPENLNLFQRNNSGQTAFDFAFNNELVDVYRIIGALMNGENNRGESKSKIRPWAEKEMPQIPNFPEQVIDINGQGYDPILLEERNIKEYLDEDKQDNIVIVYESKVFLLSRSTIERQMSDGIVFECINAEGIKDPPNIVHNLPLFNIKIIGIDIPQDKIGLWPEFIYLDGINYILESKDKLFSIMPLVDKMLVSVISLHEAKKIGTDQGTGFAALHCQNGQGGMAGIIIPAKSNMIAGKKKRKSMKKRKSAKKKKTMKKRKSMKKI